MKVCRGPCGRELPLEDFPRDAKNRDGRRTRCKACSAATYAAWQSKRKSRSKTPELEPDPLADASARRQASDFSALKPGHDFDVTVGNDGRIDPKAAREKRQEFSESMGDFLRLLTASGGDPGKMPLPEMEKNAYYLATVSEQERRFQNRRLARTISLTAANEQLQLRMMMQMAKDYFAEKVVPAGAALRPAKQGLKRTACILLSDLHFGSALSGRDNPEPYGPDEESRRFGKIIAEVMDYKPAHRADTNLLVMVNGDIIEGMLLHDLRSGVELPEQKGAALSYLARAIASWAAVYPNVHVEWQPGNHGRDKLRHPGRATASKWSGHEWHLGYTLAQMCGALRNVSWSVPYMAVSSIPVHGHMFLMTHGDTEIKLGDPDSKAKENERELSLVNSNRRYGHEYAVGCFGHFHKMRWFPWRSMEAMFNGCLVPPNGHARGSGYSNERCGQLLWEATEDYAVGDVRFLRVGGSEDRDPKLNDYCPAFRFGEDGPRFLAA